MKKENLTSFQDFNEERFTKRVIHKTDDSTAFVLNFMPGQGVPTHTHPGSDLYVTVLQGAGTLTVDEVEHTLKKDDVVFTEGHEAFAFTNTGDEPASLFAVLSKVPDERYAKDQ
ncbi:cupin [Ammoniphilus oxalaticus]|uniref:Cupin n=1 Tax=Ammoniphilus oxalaticus TaxID=66863 RepID=A0A419SLL0_9BACL|nr:cupin domain-containing protein [Ammoniphilus oxalaticus]RKD24948.1 cupin [Ammoniphilus oxalaticus]